MCYLSQHYDTEHCSIDWSLTLPVQQSNFWVPQDPHVSIVGSVVECSPATRAARVRFPDDAQYLFLFGPEQFPRSVTFYSSGSKGGQGGHASDPVKDYL